MIIEEGKYYLYRHLNNENIPFYIGIGTKNKRKRGFLNYSSEYHRAFSKSNRNKSWYIIANKGISVEILLESDNYQFIKEKEKEFIKLYKRTSENGILVNLNAGGQGSLDFSHTKKVYQYDLEGNFIKEWKSCDEISEATKCKTPCLYFAIRKNRTYKNNRYFYEFKGTKIKSTYKWNQGSRIKTIIQYDKEGNIIKEYKGGAYEVCKEIGCSLHGIKKALLGHQKTLYGFVFKYKDINPDKRSRFYKKQKQLL